MPKPEVLDPNRMSVTMSDAHDHEREQQRLRRALGDTCAYGDMLWHELQRVRAFLAEMADPDVPTATRPGDQAAWDSWAHVYTEVTSALAGPTGDSGLALGEARTMARRHGVSVLGSR